MTFYHGAAVQIAAERDTLLNRIEQLLESGGRELRPRTTDVPVLSGDARGVAFDFVAPAIDGLSAGGVFRAEAGDRLANV